MTGYPDLQREAFEALEHRRYRRRRLISGIRGWLRREYHPRWLAFGIFVVAAVPGAAVAYAASRCGVEAWGAAPAIGIFAMWPVFVWLSGIASARIGRRDDFLDEMSTHVAFDEAVEAGQNKKMFAHDKMEDAARGGWNAGIQGGMRGAGGGGLPAMLVLSCVTMGAWIIWDLVRGCPSLFAETILDGHLARRHPELHERAEIQNWRHNACAATALHFLGLGTVAFVLGATLYCSRAFWER